MVDLSKFKEDRDVIEPFVERLLLRVREKRPTATMADIALLIEVSVPNTE